MASSSKSRKSTYALLLVDVINDLEFDSGAKLLKHALPAAKKLAALVARAREAKIPIIFANDNFGHWRSDFHAIVRHCLDEDVRGRPIAELLTPEQEDYFVLKPKHSAFFSTALETLLHSIGVRTLILAGFAGDICVLFTAHDAHMREYELFVPSDCSASENPDSNRWALRHMRDFLRVDTRVASKLDLHRLKRKNLNLAAAEVDSWWIPRSETLRKVTKESLPSLFEGEFAVALRSRIDLALSDAR